ncbi:Putative L,D-transpeptidase YkuD [Ferriphaselus amnicola]|uniref:L,D-transpeptidase YkuD n=1 Tax=Ferriphaselus amnicola TaxID=1188319 RepID=A0A2Z6GDA1_9PROT|nr:L,D-transpeptidase [Ferriphaselus amnicola]BBE51309.1 Putative L,D-transpeptidase YkuD [Ferriphaselus amnicola]
MKIVIHIPCQLLELSDDTGTLLRRYPVSTGASGAGEESGSFCTPRGRHVIRAKVGAGQPENTVFVRRRPTGEIYSPELGAAYPGRDWILTRILWLSGCESGYNRSGTCDTMRRYVYIHGTPDETELGKPGSHGCVRMRNRDLIELFEQVPVGTPVNILA